MVVEDHTDCSLFARVGEEPPRARCLSTSVSNSTYKKRTRLNLDMNRPSNPPHKHHYVPQFYLAQWATAADDRLCEYSRPYDEVKPKRRHPAETGYIDRLYELKGL